MATMVDEELSLRDVLELAREYRCARLQVGDVIVELSPQGWAPAELPAPVVPSREDVAAVDTRPQPPSHYKALFGRVPRFEDFK